MALKSETSEDKNSIDLSEHSSYESSSSESDGEFGQTAKKEKLRTERALRKKTDSDSSDPDEDAIKKWIKNSPYRGLKSNRIKPGQ